MTELSRDDILGLFEELNKELSKGEVCGEIYLVGGAVMCLVFASRPSTRDIDAFFKPAQKIRKAAARVALKKNISTDWLNDGVRGFLSDQGEYDSFLDLSNLKIMTGKAEYMLAMKCLAMRIGEEFHDEEDVRYLLRNLDIRSYKKAIDIIGKYFPIDRFPQKTLYALEEILETKK